jgi:2-polyprenyl-6-hydroxyphenyl methylase/3-demethylubiquinone-9 3-methyltransferase
MTAAQEETRFGFGKNWANYLATVDDERILEAERSLVDMIGREAIAGQRWLDIGSGSGLFSLAAARLGASTLHSFDYDPDSVACTAELRRRAGIGDDRWTVEQGSVLDGGYIDGLGRFDVVYSWGVLHHTGDLWEAFGNAVRAVAPGGLLWIAIYNDQGPRSSVWSAIKYLYNRLPSSLRTPYAVAIMLPRELLSFAVHTAKGRPRTYVRSWTQYQSARGMSRWHDLIDWVGGYPFEVASPELVFTEARKHALTLEHLVAGRGLGCNQYVFRRPAA